MFDLTRTLPPKFEPPKFDLPKTKSLLNEEQIIALDAITHWLEYSKEPFFLLSGSAGTGKTFCVKELTSRNTGCDFAFTAPTNKATKVLRDSIYTRTFKPVCKTIYSLLGLKLGTDGEVKAIKKGEALNNLSLFTAVVVDEASMINKELYDIICEAAVLYNVRFLFMGDAAQLPPIGEKSSAVWKITNTAKLTKIMRYDNAILRLANELRGEVDKSCPSIKFRSDNNESVALGTSLAPEGVWKYNKAEFEERIKKDAAEGLFSVPNESKVISWRNVRVDYFNRLIREAIFPDSKVKWNIGERVLFMAPVVHEHGYLIATTDDEGEIIDVDVNDMGEFKIWSIQIRLDFEDKLVVADVMHEDSLEAYEATLREYANECRVRERKWSEYWALKEQYHEIKYAYAITAHRSQGSTYDTAFVCWQDVLRNSDVQEAYRCLYVACTRPKRCLIFS
jgi:exodeoxyribonuclease-5